MVKLFITSMVFFQQKRIYFCNLNRIYLNIVDKIDNTDVIIAYYPIEVNNPSINEAGFPTVLIGK